MKDLPGAGQGGYAEFLDWIEDNDRQMLAEGRVYDEAQERWIIPEQESAPEPEPEPEAEGQDEHPTSITSPTTGRVLQLEYTPCGVRRCKRCFEGPKDARTRRDPPIGHGPYYRIYQRPPTADGARQPLRGHHVRRDEEGELEAEFGGAYKRLQPRRWGQWSGRR